MKIIKMIKKFPDKLKHRFRTVLLLTCVIITFVIPIFNSGYSILKTEHITSSAVSIEDIDLAMVASTAFGEARKVMNASNPDDQEQFIKNTNSLIGGLTGYKWQNMGLLIGPRDALSGSTWNVFQNPTALSMTEVMNYNDDGITRAYKKYKAFGYAVELLNARSAFSRSSTVSLEEGLDSMSLAALKLGNFGVKFLNDYNPAPVVLALYDSSNLSTYSDNRLVQIINNNQIMKQIICLFGDKVAGTGLSFFIIINAVVATVVLGLSMLLTLLGNQNIGDGIRKFLIRVVIGTVGIYLIGNLMSIMLKHVSETVLNTEASENMSYIEDNLNLYDWYLTGFSLPSGLTLKIDNTGQFLFDGASVKAINEYTYKRLTGTEGSADDIRERMENYAEMGRSVAASFVTPTYVSATDTDGEGQAWATDVYYAIMKNFGKNVDLMDGKDNESSALNQYVDRNYFSLTMSRYLWMSSLTMNETTDGWNVSMNSYNNNFYGVNPITAFNILRTEFSGNNIVAMSQVSPTLFYITYNAVNVDNSSDDGSNMNSVLRFVAIFTIIMAALKGMITIFTAGFGGILSGGIKTATGSSHGLGQAIGGVIAIFGGLIGISLILSVTMTLLNALYGIAYELLKSNEIIDAILEPIQDAVGDIPLIGDFIMDICESIVGFLLTLIFSLTFPKLGGIPINVFCQYMADLPGKIAERAQMIESMLLSGRSSAGHGLGRGGGNNNVYGRMAGAQASQALASGQKQAGKVIGSLMGASAALAGMGLSQLGKALNNKADSMEGKPSNPGLDNWDDLSPEQQTAAAAAAADMGEDWNNMDQDARQKAMEDRMAADEARAQEATDAAQEANDQFEDETFADEQESMAADTMDDSSEIPENEQESLAEDGLNNTSDVPENPDMNDNILDGMNTAKQEAAANNVDNTDGLNNSQHMDTNKDKADKQSNTDDLNNQSNTEGLNNQSNMSAGETDAGETDNSSESEDLNDSSSMESLNDQPTMDAAEIDKSSNSEGLNNQQNMEAGESLNTNEANQGFSYDQNDQSENGISDEDKSIAQQAVGDSDLGDNTTDHSYNEPNANGSSIDESMSGDGNVVNYNNNQESVHAEQKVGNDIQSNLENKNVDNSNVKEDGDKNLDIQQGREGNAAPTSAHGSMNNGGEHGKGVNKDGMAAASGNMAVNAQNNQTMKAQTNQAMRAQNNQTTNVQSPHTTRSNSNNMNRNTGNRNMNNNQGRQTAQRSTSQQGMNNTNQQRTNNANQQRPNTSQQSMNGTNSSAWGKNMSIKEQRKARLMHAIGDGLQMAGGNRTVGDGLRDAMGHLKDAAVSYTVPDEFVQHNVVNNIRNSRKRHEKKKNG